MTICFINKKNKYIYFSAPAFKWGLVLAGLKDIGRHASQLSIAQTIALAATGMIWSRYSLVIIPKNWSLFAVNMLVAIIQLVQLGRAIHYYYFEEHIDEALILPTNATDFLETSDGGGGSGWGPFVGNLTAASLIYPEDI